MFVNSFLLKTLYNVIANYPIDALHLCLYTQQIIEVKGKNSMDFTRGSRPAGTGTPEGAGNTTKSKSHRKNFLGGMGATWMVFLILVAGLILALVLFVIMGSRRATSSSDVQTDKYQAVFLTNGQVYFGKITDQTVKTVRLQDIYYLTPTQTVQPKDKKEQAQPNFTLVKLGCELHGPQDLMIIERSQLSFWENLKDDGKVAEGIKQFKQQNPDGLKCDTKNQDKN